MDAGRRIGVGMSNYNDYVIDPDSGKIVIAEFLDDYFGRHRYAVRLADQRVYRLEDVKHANSYLAKLEESLLTAMTLCFAAANGFKSEGRLELHETWSNWIREMIEESGMNVEAVAQRVMEKSDDEWVDGELALAATSYVMPADRRVLTDFTKDAHPIEWPWDDEWWKPTPNDRIRELTKAGALIAAEIDRLMRASAVRADDAQ